MPRYSTPDSFDFDKPAFWPEWKKRYERFRSIEKIDQESGRLQVDSLIYTMGPEAEKIFASLTFPPTPEPSAEQPVPIDPREDYATVVKLLDDYFVPKRNIIYERAKFNTRNQQPGESAEAYIRSVTEQASKCDFQAAESEMIRDRLVVGMLDKDLSQKLQLNRDKLTLEEVKLSFRDTELVKKQNATSVDFVRSASGRDGHDGRDKKKASKKKKSKGKADGSTGAKCTKCGLTTHRSGKCPASEAICHKCNKKGHFKSVCMSKVDDVKESAADHDYFLGRVRCEDSDPAWKIDLDVGNENWVNFKIDSGADVSIMSSSEYNSLRPKPKLLEVKTNLMSPGGKVQAKGQFIAHTKLKDTRYDFRVIVVESDIESLLSRGAASKMGLIKRLDAVAESIGSMKTEPVKIELKSGAEPYAVTTPRRVPFPLEQPVKEELERLKKLKVIREITKPTPYCAPMVPVMKKNGKVRLCVDLKKLNANVKRERFILPTLEDLTSKLAGASRFSSLDAASGYYQIPLDEASQELTTFITPFGRFCFLRLPFGISSACEIFMRKMREALEGLEGVFVYMDDICVFAATPEEHDRRLEAVLTRIKEVGLVLNLEKCVFRTSELKFIGHLFSKDGVRPDQEKVAAICNMPIPSSVEQLRQVLGMVHYLGAYVPEMHMVTRPLNDLLKKDSAWHWDAVQQEAFDEIKRRLTTAPVLAYYDVKKPTFVSADASSYGLGAVLLQSHDGKMKPVAYCSRTLSPAETRYAQIEKECLAGVWACEKFDRYLCGLDKFTLYTDHKPLVPLINSKDLDDVPLRCQRLLMRLMRYNAEAKHVPGKEMYTSDALSRSPVKCDQSDTSKEVELYVQMVEASFPASPGKKADIRKATQEDRVMQAAIVYTLTGWPDNERRVPEELKSFFHSRTLLSIVDGLLVYGNRIVVPESMRSAVLDRIHDGHQGITKCLERARLGVWWPGITADVKKTVENCHHCLERRPTQRREPLIPTPLPQGPWNRIAMDLCQHKSYSYLVVSDYFSRWIEAIRLGSTTSEAVVQALKGLIKVWGFPKEIVSDNGPQFTGSAFQKFCEEYNIRHITSSPELPNSNGEAEMAVKIAKSLLDQDEPWLAFLTHRDTPIAATGCSPSQLMICRHLRTTLPVIESSLEPTVYDPEMVRQRDFATKVGYSGSYNRRHGVRELEPLQPGQPVAIKTDRQKDWTHQGRIVGEADAPRSYQVETPSGSLRRNRRHLLPLPVETPPPVLDWHDEDKPAETETAVPESTVSQPTVISEPNNARRVSTRIRKEPERLITVI